MGRQRPRRDCGERRTRDDVDNRVRRLRPQFRLRLGAPRSSSRRHVAHPADAHGRGSRGDRAPAGPSRQRPARRHVRRRCARLSETLRRAGWQAHRDRNQQRQRLCGRRGAQRGERRGRGFRPAGRGAGDKAQGHARHGDRGRRRRGERRGRPGRREGANARRAAHVRRVDADGAPLRPGARKAQL